jgi:hypothetical protein
VLICFQTGSYFMSELAWTSVLLFVLPSWEDRLLPLCPIIGWDGVLQTFGPGWPQTVMLPFSASQVARIIGLSYNAQS